MRLGCGFLSHLLPPLSHQHSDSSSRPEPQGMPFLALPSSPPDCPSRPPSPLTSCPRPARRKDRRRPAHAPHSTLPTRPKINISRETELVLSVFTAKGQAEWGEGRGRPEEPHPALGPTASGPALPQTCCVTLSQSPPLSEPPLQALKGTSLGLGLPTSLAQLQLHLLWVKIPGA